jgi:phospholipid-binding lipoprotein MlaA
MRIPLWPIGLVLSLLLSGCATSMAGAPAPAGRAAAGAEAAGDPLEGFNRLMFRLGGRLDRMIARPVANGYRRLTPGPVRRAAHNLLQNLGEPVVFANDVLQLRPARAARTAARFVSNSTIGVAGMFDVAAKAGLPPRDNDFGATLARYGVGPGPYLFLPLLGPTTARDLAGRGVDIAADPLTWASFRGVQTADLARTGLSLADARLDAEADLTTLGVGAADPYATVRSVYRQARAAELRGGGPELEPLPDLPPEAPSGEPPEPPDGAATPAPALALEGG